MAPDNMITYPQILLDINNCLESIECTIAFDVNDWSEDKRLAWIYGIVFGWEDEEKEIQNKFSWSDDDIKRLNKLHKEWKALKRLKEIENGNNN